MGNSVTEAVGAIKLRHRDKPAGPFGLVCACLAPGKPPLPDMGAIDPKMLVRVARRHQVSALVAARIAEAGQPVPQLLARQAEAARHRSLRQLGFLLDLTEMLEREGIRAVPIKGTALSQQVFGSPLLRGAVDVDVLVRPDDVGAAWRVLARAGLTRVNPPTALEGKRLALFCRAAKDSLHHNPSGGQIVELHWRLSDEMADPAMPPDAMLTKVTLAPGREVRALPDETLFLYLCMHGAAHGWARIKWLADVAALLHRSHDGGRKMWAHARASGGKIAAGSAIILANEMFGLAPPTGFVPPRGVRITLLLWLARRIMQAGEGARELETTMWRGWAEMLAKLLVAAGWRGRLAVLRRLLLAGEDIAQVPLPPALFWLYPLLRVPLLVRRRATRLRRLRGGDQVRNTTL